MLRYFKINDPFRLIVIALVLILLRMPYYLSGDILLQSDLKLLTLGEKIAGEIWSYGDFFTITGPFTAYAGSIFFSLFGKTVIPFHVLSVILILHQCYLINKLVNINNATGEQTYLPGFIYGMLMSLSPEFYSINAVVLAQGLILTVLNYQFNHLEFRVKKDYKILLTGIYAGVFSLFFPEGILFFPTMILVFLMFSGTIFRRYLLIIFGFSIPFILLTAFYTFDLKLPNLKNVYLNIGMLYDRDFSHGIWLMAIPGIYGVFSILNIIIRGRYTNYQSRLIQAMLIWLMASLGIFYLSHSGYILYACIAFPAITFLMTHYFLNIRSSLTASFMFNLFVILSIGGNILSWKELDNFSLSRTNNTNIIENPYGELVKGRKVLVLGEEFHYYRGAKHASSFFNWKKSEPLFTADISYENISEVYLGIYPDMPDIIIDESNLFEKYRDKIPLFKKEYTRDASGKVWRRDISN